MEKFIATIKNKELRGKLLQVFGYLLSREPASLKLKRHANVIHSLYFFRHNGFVRLRTYVLYILPYLSRSFSTGQKQQLLINHYNFLQESFSIGQLRLLFNKGMACYEEQDGCDTYTIRLKAITGHLEFEGSLNLVFEYNGSPLYTLGFSFAPGKLFRLQDEQVIFIAAMQGAKNEQEAIRKATKFFKDNALPVLLLKALEGMAEHLKIRICIGIEASDQLSSGKMVSPEKCRAVYDDFWLRAGGQRQSTGFVINLPLTYKPIELISQPHRNRTLKKRNKTAAIYAAVGHHWRSLPKAS